MTHIHTFNAGTISVRVKRGPVARIRLWLALRLMWLARAIMGIEYVD